MSPHVQPAAPSQGPHLLCSLRNHSQAPRLPHFTFLLSPGGRMPRWLSGKESTCHCRRGGFHPWVGKIPWRRKRQPTPVFLPGKCHGQRSLAGHKPRVAKSPTGLGAHTSETSAPPGPLLSRHFLSSFSAAPSFAPLKGETKEGYTHWNHLSDCFSLPDCEQKESWSSLYK